MGAGKKPACSGNMKAKERKAARETRREQERGRDGEREGRNLEWPGPFTGQPWQQQVMT